MAWRPANSLPVLHRQLQQGSRAAPPATSWSEWGLIGDAAHDPTSDHSPHDFPGWGYDIVTAADFPNRPDLGLDAHQVLDDLRRSRDPRVKYAISNGQMYSSYAVKGYSAWTWRPYNPRNGDRHFTHGHLSVVGDPRADGTQPWQTIGADDMFGDEDRRRSNNVDETVWQGIVNGSPTARGLVVPNQPTVDRPIWLVNKLTEVAADAKASRLAVEALVAFINERGGTVDTATIIARMDELAAAEAAREQELLQRIADLEAQLAAPQPDLPPAQRTATPSS
ncbi:hypothetical protein ACFFX1_15230 [Dactylosporangium sucinum]|uniref:Uncharacterized protein n=1 Tax=Dactylosporangium sucinum TaxID=1424081 RepID=A0A917X7W7_9ACTN|nr:hypothetical protein [Dactylosporangium sucinum]GGM88317.1 hypothetical protein GCM10007977_107910 [Dactylosporangium sucinum]